MLQTLSISLWSPLQREQTCFLPCLQPLGPLQLAPLFHKLHTADRTCWAMCGFSFDIFLLMVGCWLVNWT